MEKYSIFNSLQLYVHTSVFLKLITSLLIEEKFVDDMNFEK